MQFPCIDLLPIFGSLKTVCLILSLVIMVMATIPCCLFDNCPGEKEHTEQHGKEHSSGDKDGCGACSPFFACSSCPVAIDQPKSFEHALKAPHVVKYKSQFALYEKHFLSSFYFSFWQPPKLG